MTHKLRQKSHLLERTTLQLQPRPLMSAGNVFQHTFYILHVTNSYKGATAIFSLVAWNRRSRGQQPGQEAP